VRGVHAYAGEDGGSLAAGAALLSAGRRRRGGSATVAAAALLAATAVCALCALTAPGAWAAIAALPDGRTLSYQPLRGSGGIAPLDAFFSNLDYNGGPVMASNTNYAVYWSPSGASAYPVGYQPGVNQYFEDLAHDSGGHENVDSVATQYNDAAGDFAAYTSHFAGALIDTDPYPADGCSAAAICLTDKQLRTELTAYVRAHGLPIDLSHQYFLLTPPGVEDCFQGGGRECSAGSTKPTYCAYHGNISLPEGELVYSNDPYVTGNERCDDGNHPNGQPSDGALEGGLSHEHNESMTDPVPNIAWTDIGGSGGENGDKCRAFNEATEFGTPLGTASNGAKYNQVINGDLYWYQQEWSNQGNRCLQRFTFSGEEPTASFRSTPGSGTEVAFDATGSTAPGGVSRYNWQFNDGAGGLSNPVETTVPTVNHTFPAASFYVVALTVFASDGTSIGTARAVAAGTPPPPTVTKVTPAKGPSSGGAFVTISGSNFIGATSVRFGSTAVSFTVKSSSSVTAVTSESASGIVDVTVTTPAGTSAISLADHYKFSNPTIAGLTPASGPAAGGTGVAVTGSGFALGAGSTKFKFGGVLASGVECSSHTSCTAVAPPHKAGTFEVKATVNALSSAKDPPADQFTYQ